MIDYLLLSLFMSIFAMVCVNGALELYKNELEINYDRLSTISSQLKLYLLNIIMWPIAIPFFALGIFAFVIRNKNEND